MSDKKDSIDALLADLHKAFDDLKAGVASSDASAGDVDFLRPPPAPSPGLPEPPEAGEYEFEVKPRPPAPEATPPGQPSVDLNAAFAPEALITAAPHETAAPAAPDSIPYGTPAGAPLLSDDGEVDFAAPPPEVPSGPPTPPVAPVEAGQADSFGDRIPIERAGSAVEMPAAPPLDRGLSEGFEQFLQPKSSAIPEGASSVGSDSVLPSLDGGSGVFAVPSISDRPPVAADQAAPASPVLPAGEAQAVSVQTPAAASTTPVGARVKAFILYPKGQQDKKVQFCEQLASTITRVSKKPVSLEIVGELELADPEQDIVRCQDTILDQVKRNEIAALFLIADGVVHVDDFIKKISPYVFIAKVVNTAELKMKSLYLDISIDVLLVVK